MEQTNIERLRTLNAQLNRYRYEYYSLNAPAVSDEVYDRIFDELRRLEKETGVAMGNSPTQTVGWLAVDKLEKTKHTIPLLSLDKTKRVPDLCDFMGDQRVMLMPKLDGLTVKATYENGTLLEAATRGDGEVGEVITHNVRGISGIPAQIPYEKRLVVTGEAFIRPSDFEAMKASLLDSSGQPYKNGRNLAAGSVRLLRSEDCRDRRVTFMPFNVLEGFDALENKSDKLKKLVDLGFQPCYFLTTNRKLTQSEAEAGIQRVRQSAEASDVPIDGIVVTYNNIAYAKSCGRTGHHYKDGIAFKFEDDLFETQLRAIEWTPSRTGEIAPVAILEPVEIDGCTVSRASLHNVSFIEGLELMPGNRVLISKRNQIIPHVEENLDRGGFCMERAVIQVCSCCGQPTRIHESNGTKTLFCDNPGCETRRLRQFVHFASKKAMNIEGMSEAVLEKLIGKGWLHSFMDIYRLDEHQAEIIQMDGFGEKSWQNLWDAIQRSRDTTFERYLIAMDIPMIGNTASRTLAQQFDSSLKKFEEAVSQQYDFRGLPDFGEALHQNIHQWFHDEDHWCLWTDLRTVVHVPVPPLVEVVDGKKVRMDVGTVFHCISSAYPYVIKAVDEEYVTYQREGYAARQVYRTIFERTMRNKQVYCRKVASDMMPAKKSPFDGMTIVVTGKVEPYTREGINAKIESLGAHAGSSVSSKTNYLICGENAGSKRDKAISLGVPVLTPAEFFEMATA